MRTFKRWSAEEMALLREHYSRPGGVEFLMEKLSRPRTSLWHCARRLGIAHYMYILRGAKGAKGNKGDGARLTVETLRANTKIDEYTQCWNWIGGKGYFGYGKLMIGRKTLLAHRVMFSVANPSVDISECNVNHHCDNPACINPDHLYAGTQKDNIQDQFKRGRHRWQRANV